jgi:N-acetylmuramic acid 6-phosphate (MurNAc-6-P) etherase
MTLDPQFRLHTLLTEQRHPKTLRLTETLARDTGEGLRMLFSVDEDIDARVRLIADSDILEAPVRAVLRAMEQRNRIYIYGCGATGRLARQMESTFWRPFWRNSPLPGSAEMEELLIGEMTGGDRALISALEGLEDLQEVGRLQLQYHGIGTEDVVFCITEGGETSSVIGTALEAAEIKAKGERRKKKEKEEGERGKEEVFYLYNNPDEVLWPFERSRAVLEHPGIAKINLTTGPMAIAGSTRMQATTIGTFVMGVILEEAISRYLGNDQPGSLKERLLSFSGVREKAAGTWQELAVLTEAETETYRQGRFTTYIVQEAITTVLTDSTERSPTFRLYPLDTVEEKQRKCWIRIMTDCPTPAEAWKLILGREFRGMDKEFYLPGFSQIADRTLREAALRSLDRAGSDQQFLYNFSCRTPSPDDFILLIRFPHQPSSSHTLTIPHHTLTTPHYPLTFDFLHLRHHMMLKMMLNAHSTAVMAKLGRVTGNSMTSVQPGNLKLIGRATWLIMSQVNEILSNTPGAPQVTYEEAEEALHKAMEMRTGEESEVQLAIRNLTNRLSI